MGLVHCGVYEASLFPYHLNGISSTRAYGDRVSINFDIQVLLSVPHVII